MSKMITGTVKIEDVGTVKAACALLGWPYQESGQGMLRVDVSGEQDATYRPWIDVAIKDGQGELTFDHWMGYRAGHSVDRETNMDEVTARVIGKLKQGVARVQVERILDQQRASWRIEQRADGAQVVVVRR